MNVANIDDVLFDFLASSTDYGTFLNHWQSIKRQFPLRGLIIDEQNFPKMISLVDRQKARQKPAKKGKQGKGYGWANTKRTFKLSGKIENEESDFNRSYAHGTMRK